MTTVDGIPHFTPRPGGVDWLLWRSRWALALMLIAAVFTAPIGYGGQLGFVALIGVLGIASLPMLGTKRRPVWGVGVLVLLALWALVATGWSPAVSTRADFHRYKALEGVVGVKLILELGLYSAFVVAVQAFPRHWSGRILAILAVLFVVMAVLMSIDALGNQAAYRFFRFSAHAPGREDLMESKAARGCYTIALLFWPVALWMYRRRWLGALFILVVSFAVAAVGMSVDAPIAAVVLGGVALFAVRQFGRRAVWALLAATVIYFALAPAFIQAFSGLLPAPHSQVGIAKASWGARIDTWKFVAGAVTHQPWFGVGTDASRTFPAIPMHPHDAALQVWFELGAVGVALVVLFWAWLWGQIADVADRNASAGGVAAAVAVAYLTIGGLSFGVWQDWWLAFGALAFVIAQVFDWAFDGWNAESAESPIELVPLG